MSEKTELIPVANTTNTSNRADVLFVHGINAEPRTTWMPDNKLQGFPEESWLYWLGEDIPDVAIWTLGYPASASAWKGFTMPLKERADSITNLLLHHPHLNKNRLIIFVTHSMGGLLVKHILRRAKSGDYPNAESLVEQTKGIVFLSTPHRGSDLANFLEHLAFLLPSVNVSELKKDEETLLELNKWFCTNFNRLDLQVQAFYETQQTPVKRDWLGNLIRKIVVDKDSGTLALPSVSVTPLDADHSSICWVKSYQFRKQEQLYGNVCQFITECLSKFPDKERGLEAIKSTPEALTLAKSAEELLKEIRGFRRIITNYSERQRLENYALYWGRFISDVTDKYPDFSLLEPEESLFQSEEVEEKLTKHQDWGEAPDASSFCGRTRELAELEKWIVEDCCRVVAIFGMAGIGKTFLARKLAEEIKTEFDYIIWRSLLDAPPVTKILTDIIKLLSSQEGTYLPDNLGEQIGRLLRYLKEHRCEIAHHVGGEC